MDALRVPAGMEVRRQEAVANGFAGRTEVAGNRQQQGKLVRVPGELPKRRRWVACCRVIGMAVSPALPLFNLATARDGRVELAGKQPPGPRGWRGCGLRPGAKFHDRRLRHLPPDRCA